MSVSHTVLSAVFSDETPNYRFPSEPDPNDSVTIRLRVARGSAQRVILVFDALTMGALMTLARSDDFFDYYEAGVVCDDEEVIYRFLIECADGVRIAYDKSGARVEERRIPDFNPPSVSSQAFMSPPGPRAPFSTRSLPTVSATGIPPTM